MVEAIQSLPPVRSPKKFGFSEEGSVMSDSVVVSVAWVGGSSQT